jgi:predicted P-loop ATPase
MSTVKIKNQWAIDAPVKFSPKKKEGEKKNQTIQIIEELNLVYGFRRNSVSLRPEYMRLTESNKWFVLCNEAIQTMLIWLKAKSYSVSEGFLLGLLASEYVKSFHPIRHYFDSLLEWDGHDYISDLVSTVETDDNRVFRSYFEKWLVGLVKAGYFPNITNQQMLVFYGKQGVGKTRWFIKLLPKALKDYFFTGYTNLEDQMFQMKLGTYLLIFMDELDSYRGSKQALIKATVTQESVKIRPLYKTYDKEVKRIASFAAAINQEGFIHDLTGSRRFLVFETIKINADHDIDANRVFAQAFHLAKDKKYFHYFKDTEIIELEKRNQRFKVKSDVEFMIEKYFETCEASDVECNVLNASEVMQELRCVTASNNLKSNPNTVGTILTSMGFQKSTIGTGNSKRNGYLIKRRD